VYNVEANTGTSAIPLAMELNTFRGASILENVSIASGADCRVLVVEAIFRAAPGTVLVPARPWEATSIFSSTSCWSGTST
jgi:hypothetical protein